MPFHGNPALRADVLAGLSFYFSVPKRTSTHVFTSQVGLASVKRKDRPQ